MLCKCPYGLLVYIFISFLARNILDNMLALDPEERLSAEQCLQHPYFESYHDPEDEVCNIRCNIG